MILNLCMGQIEGKKGIVMFRKYGNKKVEVDGIKFDSKHEAARFIILQSLQKTGEISGLELQKKFVLIPAQYEESNEVYTKGKHKGEKKKGKLLERECAYYADFYYFDERTQEYLVEDAKGMKTEVYKIKKKLMLKVHGVQIKEV